MALRAPTHRFALAFTKTSQIRTQLRTMASSSSSAATAAAAAEAGIPSQKYEFLVIVPDKPGMREKRLEVRPIHFQNFPPMIESGSWKMGGALLNDVPKDDTAESLDFWGSTLVCIAESKQEVLDQLHKDIYATSGVWDMDKAQVFPFKKAFRLA